MVRMRTRGRKKANKKEKTVTTCHSALTSFPDEMQERHTANQGMEMCTEWYTAQADTNTYLQALFMSYNNTETECVLRVCACTFALTHDDYLTFIPIAQSTNRACVLLMQFPGKL